MSKRDIFRVYPHETQAVQKKNTVMWWVIFAVASLFCIAVGRLVDLMILQGEHFRALSDENRLFGVSIPAKRGIIFDRGGIALTQNVPHYYIATSSAQLLFGNEWSLPEITAESALSYFIASPSSVFIRSQRGEIASPAVSHLIGYTGYVSDVGPLGRPTQIRVGRTGLEKTYEKDLAGVPGEEVLEISAKGVPQRSIVMDSVPQAGKSITTSIDLDLSNVAYNAMAGEPGAVVVSDIPTGQLLVLMSSPSYTVASLSAALSNPNKPLLNRALTGYPPGSTFKLMTALTALKDGTITKDTTVDDEGEIKLGEQVFGNWYWREYGKKEGLISLERAIARSNDIYFYKTAGTVGPDKMDAMASDFGFGKPTGIEISAESIGLLPNSAWKEKKIGEKWYSGDTYNMGIGQGYVLATPAQVNNMTATIARRGTWCPLTLLFSRDESCTDIDIDHGFFDLLINGMVGACSSGGTAFPIFPINATLDDAHKIACKTGTAEFGGPYGPKGWKRTHGWYTMFYPRDKPKVAITVFMESTPDKPYLEGSTNGAPIALKVFEEWKKKYDTDAVASNSAREK